MGLSTEEVAAFEEYFYHIMAARGSGEHALRHLLAPFARAKHPLEGRLHDLKVTVGTLILILNLNLKKLSRDLVKAVPHSYHLHLLCLQLERSRQGSGTAKKDRGFAREGSG